MKEAGIPRSSSFSFIFLLRLFSQPHSPHDFFHLFSGDRLGLLHGFVQGDEDILFELSIVSDVELFSDRAGDTMLFSIHDDLDAVFGGFDMDIAEFLLDLFGLLLELVEVFGLIKHSHTGWLMLKKSSKV